MSYCTSGYYFVAGNKGFFYITDAAKKTKNVVRDFIWSLGIYKGLDNQQIERIIADRDSYKDIQRLMEAATLEQRTAADGTEYYRIWNKNCILNWPAADFEKKVHIFEGNI